MFVELPELGSVSLSINHSLQRLLGDDDPCVIPAHWSSTLEARDGEFRPTTLATAETYVVYTSRLGEWDVHEVLDAVSADVAHYALLFDEEDESDDGVFAAWEASGIIIADRVTVDPRFRRHGLGPLLLAETLWELGAACDLAVCTPAPFELETGALPSADGETIINDAAAAAAWSLRQQELRVLWARLGFRQFRETEIFTLRPFSPEFESAVLGARTAVLSYSG